MPNNGKKKKTTTNTVLLLTGVAKCKGFLAAEDNFLQKGNSETPNTSKKEKKELL